MKRLGFALAAAFWCLPVHADEAMDRCLGAHERGQREELSSKLTRAVDAYRECSEEACPKLLRADCAKRLARVEAAVPTLRITIAGADASEVKVAIDDGELAPVPSEPLPVDPGSHRLRFETSDGRSVTREAEVAAGRRDVEVAVQFEPQARPSDVSSDAPAPDASEATSPAVYVLGGVALLGVGAFVGFGLAGRSKESELDGCKPDCPGGKSATYDDMQRNYLIADVALGIGLASAALATYLYLNGKPDGPRVGVTPSRSGSLITWGSSF